MIASTLSLLPLYCSYFNTGDMRCGVKGPAEKTAMKRLVDMRKLASLSACQSTPWRPSEALEGQIRRSKQIATVFHG
jgi:hypothetical protein